MKHLHIADVTWAHDLPNEYRVWDAYDNYPPEDVVTRVATARLFKAAPKMLRALKAIHDNPDGARIIAAAAIKEAEGK